MGAYLRWVARQFYLLFFWPSRYRRELKGTHQGQTRLTWRQRFIYLTKLLPWIVVLAVVGNVLSGVFVEFVLRNPYSWAASWVGVVYAFAFGVAFGFGGGIEVGIAFGIAGGFAIGGAAGLVAGIDIGFGIAIGIAMGVAVGVLGGDRYIVIDLTVAALVGVLFGTVAAILVGVATGFPFGVRFGVASGTAIWLTYFRLANYPFDALLSWIVAGLAQRNPTDIFRLWPFFPISWNEVIWFPLPGVRTLLALMVRQDREEGFRQIAFVASERSLQRRAAVGALTDIALKDLETASYLQLGETPERLRWTTEAVLPLPAEVTEALPRFERVARQAAQSAAVSSAYRKADALKRAVKELDTLQKSLIAARGREVPRLLQIANAWRELLDTEQSRLQVLAAERREVPNPFVFGNPVDAGNASVFAGRGGVIQQIEQSLLGARQAPVLLLHGPRRMGKSSILKQLPRLLGPDFAPALLDCQNPAVAGSEGTAASLLRHVSVALCEGLNGRRVEIAPLAVEELARTPFGTFDNWLNRLEQALPAGMRTVLCLDEYEKLQRAVEAGWGGEFLDALRHWLQHRPRLLLLFTGVRTFAELGPAWSDRFVSARRVRVSFLHADDVRQLLTRPIPEFDLAYGSGAVEAVIDATRCQPFLVQAVAFELVQHMNEQQRKEATPDDVELAITRALESGGEYFGNVWSDAGPDGQAVLRALAAGRPAAGTPAVLRWLRDHDVLDDAGDFAVPMMRRWVAEHNPLGDSA
jgi:uncharacterized protein